MIRKRLTLIFLSIVFIVRKSSSRYKKDPIGKDKLVKMIFYHETMNYIHKYD